MGNADIWNESQRKDYALLCSQQLERTYGINSLPPFDFSNADDPFQARLAWLQSREETKRNAQEKWGDYFLPLNDLNISLADVAALQTGLLCRHISKGRPRDIFTGLLQIENDRLLEKVENIKNIYPDWESDVIYPERVKDSERLDVYHRALTEIWNLTQSQQDLYWEEQKRIITRFCNEYFIPAHLYMGEPIALPYDFHTTPEGQYHADSSDLLHLVNQMSSLLSEKSVIFYQEGPFAEEMKKRLIQHGFGSFSHDQNRIWDSTGRIIRYPPFAQDKDSSLPSFKNYHYDKDRDFIELERLLSESSQDIAGMINSRSYSPACAYIFAEFATVILLEAKMTHPQNSHVYYDIASKAFDVAEQLGQKVLKDEDQRDFLGTLSVRRADALLYRALGQLYDYDQAQQTQLFLERALQDLQSLNVLLPGRFVNSAERQTSEVSYQATAALYHDYLTAWTLYHLGMFFKDVRNDSSTAIHYFEQAGEKFKLLPIDSNITQKALEQMDVAKGVITIDSAKKGQVEIPIMEHLKYLTLIEAAMQQSVINQYKEIGLEYQTVPQMVDITGSCEDVSNLFSIVNRAGVPLFMSQTGQMSLELSLQFNKGVYTVIHSARNEINEDKRHLRQFRLTEEEFGCSMLEMTRETYNEEAMYEGLLVHIESATKAQIRGAVESHADVLQTVYSRNIAEIQNVLDNPYLRITYTDAIDLLQKNGYQNLTWGSDLKAEHEQAVIQILNTARRAALGEKAGVGDLGVLILRYDKNMKFFNMKVSETDPRVVLSADLILPYAGEATGGAVREHNGKKLRERLRVSTMYQLLKEQGITERDFEGYLSVVDKERTDPHAGYGIGNERVMQFIFGQRDIRVCSSMFILAAQSGGWEKRESPLLTK